MLSIRASGTEGRVPDAHRGFVSPATPITTREESTPARDPVHERPGPVTALPASPLDAPKTRPPRIPRHSPVRLSPGHGRRPPMHVGGTRPRTRILEGPLRTLDTEMRRARAADAGKDAASAGPSPCRWGQPV